MKIKPLIFGLFLASISVSAFSQDEDCATKNKLKASILKETYGYIDCFHENMAIVSNHSFPSKNTKYGFIDTTGKLVIPMEFSKINQFHEGLALVSKGDSDYFIDKTGKTVLNVSDYDFNGGYTKGLVKVGKDDISGNPFLAKQGYIDTNGKVVIPFEYMEIESFSNGMALATKYIPNVGLRMGVVNLQNEPVIPFDYSFLDGFKDGLSIAVKGCDLIISPDAERIDSKKCRYGMIDSQNKTLVPFDYQFIGKYKNGVALAQKDNMLGKIDKHGNIVVHFTDENQRELLEDVMRE